MVIYDDWRINMLLQAITLYWGTSNLISLLFGTLFKMKFVRQKLNIPEFVKYEKKSSDMTHIMKMLKARSSKPFIKFGELLKHTIFQASKTPSRHLQH